MKISKEEMVNRPDFNNLVFFAIKKYKLQSSIKRLGIDQEDFPHEVRCRIWNLAYPTVDIAPTTFITKHTVWAAKDDIKMSESFNNGHSSDIDNFLNKVSAIRNHEGAIDDKDEVSLIQKAPINSRIKFTVINTILGEKTLEETSKEMGVTRQRVQQLRDLGLSLMKDHFKNKKEAV